ncbi:NAD(P)/FAD-dependent oxidoreductase [Patescibacteria group bacterium]|nr:NAD(P)/FAD-dependent oxidoreductase [Patescibacteria group bacterium]
MKKVDYLIIGGGIAGTTTAEFIRMNDSSGSISIVMEEPELLYSRVLLPHYLRNQIPFERLYVRRPENYEEKNIKLIKGERANSIDTQKKEIRLVSGDILSYEKLLISSGGKVNKLDIPGKNLKGVTYLRTIEDVKEVKEIMKNANKAVVVGGGFIGIEYAQSFVKAGIDTTCFILDPYFWERVVGENIGKLLSNILEKNGVKIVPESEVTEFVGTDSLEKVRTKRGMEASADIVGIGIGIHMEMAHLKDSGLKIDRGIITNEFLEADTKDVWVAGDIAQFYDVLFNKHHQMGNWSNAAAQGKVAGPNMVAGWGKGEREKFITVSAYTIGIFDNTFTFMGDPIADKQTEVVERGSIQEGKLGRIHLRNNVITGAALLNLPADRRPIEELIKNRVKIRVEKNKLADINFSLNKVLEN